MRELSVPVVYTPYGGWTSYILDAPAFVNRAFVERFPGGLSGGARLFARRAAGSGAGAGE